MVHQFPTCILACWLEAGETSMTMSGVRSLCSAGEAAGGVASRIGLGAAERAAARAFITEVASA
jgi:hypothetical protein